MPRGIYERKKVAKGRKPKKKLPINLPTEAGQDIPADSIPDRPSRRLKAAAKRYRLSVNKELPQPNVDNDKNDLALKVIKAILILAGI